MVQTLEIKPGDALLNGKDVDPTETAEWLESLLYVLKSKGPGTGPATALGTARRRAAGRR